MLNEKTMQFRLLRVVDTQRFKLDTIAHETEKGFSERIIFQCVADVVQASLLQRGDVKNEAGPMEILFLTKVQPEAPSPTAAATKRHLE